MSNPQNFTIDLNETFPSLRRSPLIEAVIHWQAYANPKLEPKTLQAELSRRLPDFPNIQTQYEYGVQIETPMPPDGSVVPSSVAQQTQWVGFRLENEAKNRVIQFTQTGIVVSSIGKYETWETFHQEALNLWSLFREIAKPTVIQRLGVRYINKILLEEGETASTYLKTIQPNNFELPLIKDTFFHQETYKLPNYPYRLNWICTQQSEPNQRFLIVDLDVSISPLLDLEQSLLIEHLQKIRWLKNKVFFNSITDKSLAKFGG
ncbi:MAG: TIGR04255 family protein [Jaaginema sp. PMC 1079.18]|nr:TIGR04255 family protein [Jaaginema sp. PMC 1080.18]MEC4853823.1 TIGR04255 family protein [Jaaginema sp. PMC 1079.18]MEC4865356.1 TIGR04255 family protein [Jaaginema sp. PMC 1078.18]